MHERPFSAAYEPGTSTLTVGGAVDELAAPTFRDDLAAALAAGPGPVVVDLTEVDYLPSVAVSVLVAALAAKGGGAPVLRAARGTIAQRVLELCGLPHRTE
jgi:anti-anti-sigma factor